jgi:CheY-like chemotaxis protein
MVERKGYSFYPKFDTIGLDNGECDTESCKETPLNVLHIDDKKEVTDAVQLRVGLTETVENVSYEAANSGKEAIERLPELLKDGKVNVIFLDWKMPGMNGFEVARLIKAMPGTEAVPVIMLTADPYDPAFPSKNECEESGIDVVFDKMRIHNDFDGFLSLAQYAIHRKQKMLEEKAKRAS